ncbi:hypothetical protein JTB14_006142 [Gonioctena quinquepunctata]|nr:hypothetical protein JTB14_006142 [Gonioctena quinquepunctata]
MSRRLTRNSSAQIKRNNENITGKNYTVVPEETNSPKALCNQSVIASKRKTFPCQYCAKVFPKKISSLNHMKKCPKKNTTTITDGTSIGKTLGNNKTDGNNSNADNNQYEVINDSGRSKESDGFSENLIPKIEISQNMTMEAPRVKTEIFSSPEISKPSDPMDIFTYENETSRVKTEIFFPPEPSDPLDIFTYENETPRVKAEIFSLPIEDNESGNVSMYDYNEDISGSLTYSEIIRCDEDRTCNHCHKFFENSLDLLRHSRIFHLPLEEVEKYFDYPNKSFCPICKKSIKTMNWKSAFVRHLLGHTDELAHECSICKKKFRRMDHMRAHEKRHIEASASGDGIDYNEDISGGMTYSEVKRCVEDRKCKHCNKFFENPLDRLHHSRLYHNFPKIILPLEEVEKYFDYPNRKLCPICEKPINLGNHKSKFINHLLVHTDRLEHECSICKKRFTRRGHMRAHEKRHIVNG